MTAPDLNATCPHGKRAGITVCLHCRHDARMAARQRRNRMLARGGGIVLAAGVVVGMAVAALIAVSPRARTTESAAPVSQSAAPVQARAAVAVTKAPPAVPVATRARQDVPAKPVMADGRISLGDSVYAERSGAEVTVFFDNAIWRTRFEEKFERLVRTTLPMVAGEGVKAALDSVPEGQLVRGGDLLRDLPVRGIPVALPAQGGTVMVYPITRPGDNGPLVVAYRVALPR